MNDSLNQHAAAWSGIPDIGIRFTLFIIIAFILVIAFVLLYFRMKEADQAESLKQEHTEKSK